MFFSRSFQIWFCLFSAIFRDFLLIFGYYCWWEASIIRFFIFSFRIWMSIFFFWERSRDLRTGAEDFEGVWVVGVSWTVMKGFRSTSKSFYLKEVRDCLPALRSCTLIYWLSTSILLSEVELAIRRSPEWPCFPRGIRGWRGTLIFADPLSNILCIGKLG